MAIFASLIIDELTPKIGHEPTNSNIYIPPAQRKVILAAFADNNYESRLTVLSIGDRRNSNDWRRPECVFPAWWCLLR